MPVNFNILGAIPAPQVVGTVPGVAPSNSADSLAGGLMSGLMQGQQMQQSAQAMAAQKQQMDQSAQLFPIQKETAQTNLEKSKLDLTDAKQKSEYQAKLMDYANKTEDQYLNSLAPQDRYEILTKKAQFENAKAVANKAGVEAGYTMTTYMGAANSAAMAQEDPQKAQGVYTQIRSTAPTDVQKLMPEQFDPKFAPIAVAAGMRAEAQALGPQKAPEGTNDMKNAQRLAELDQKEQDGRILPQEQKEKARLESLTSKAESSTGLEKAQGLVDKLQSQYDAIPNKNSPEAKRLKEKLIQAQQDVQKSTDLNLNTKIGNKVSSFLGFADRPVNDGTTKSAPPSNYSQEDLEHTAQKYGITVDQVKQKLGIK